MKIRLLNEWKDKFTGKDMYDYHTGSITGDEIFDVTKTGMSYYNDLLPTSGEQDYFKNNKNLYGEIIYLTPEEYFEACVKYAFPNSSVKNLKNSRSIDAESLNDIKTVIDNDVQLPITVINAANKSQEGLHRMYVVGERFGWNNKKYPVLFVDYFDKELQKKWEEQSKIYEIESKIEDAVKEACRYTFNSFDEFLEELQWKLNSEFKYYDKFDDEEIPFDVNTQQDSVTITVLDVPFTFDSSIIKIEPEELEKNETEEDDIEWDFSDIDLDNMSIDEILRKLK